MPCGSRGDQAAENGASLAKGRFLSRMTISSPPLANVRYFLIRFFSSASLTFRMRRDLLHGSYTFLIGPGYCDTKESMVSSVTPSTVACATKILSKGSLCIGGKLSMATT